MAEAPNAATLTTATLNTIEGRPVLRMERPLRHSADKVWRALTEPDQLTRWYPFQATEIDLRVGGTIHFRDEAGNPHNAVITHLDPPTHFAFHIANPGTPGDHERDNHLSFELHPHPKGCLLTLTHTFDDRPAAASYAAGWQTCLDQLEPLLNGTDPTPPDMRLMIPRHERFIELFGLDRGDRIAGGVRFERQLMMRDVDTVWSTLPNTDGQSPPTVEYQEGAARIRWELSSGPGGARITLTRTGDKLDDARSDLELVIKRLYP